jgi:hypothetical protein
LPDCGDDSIQHAVTNRDQDHYHNSDGKPFVTTDNRGMEKSIGGGLDRNGVQQRQHWWIRMEKW